MTLKRLGVAALAAVTMGAGVPAFFATSASAAPATTIDLAPESGTAAPGECQTFTVTLRDANNDEASDTGTVTVTVTEGSDSGTQSLTFCAPAGRTATTGEADSNPAVEVFGGVTSFTFGIVSSTAGSANITVNGTSNDGRGLTGDSGTFTFATAASPSASATPTATTSPTASATPTATTSATPTATTSPRNSPPGCAVAQRARTRVITNKINAGNRGIVEVDASPNSIVELFAYTRPSTTFRKVREAEVGADGRARFANLVPPANTRFQAREKRGVGCAFGDFGDSVVMNVRTTISLNVTRLGKQTYRFFGDTLPARGQTREQGLIVSLYRVTNDGRQVLTAQTRALPLTAGARSGEYSLVRRFTGTGRFGFVVRTGQDLQNAPGNSNVRSLLVF